MDTEIIVALIGQAGILVGAIIQQNRKLKAIGDDAREARDQTANTHTTNLRDDLDRMDSTMNRIALDVRALHEEDSSLGDTLSRARIKAANAVRAEAEERAEHISEVQRGIPLAVTRGIAVHVTQCPLRNGGIA